MSGPPGQFMSGRAPFHFETRRPAEEKSAFFIRLRNFANRQGWSRAIANEVELILEEWLADVIAYGVGGRSEPFLKIEIFPGDRAVRIVVTDNGPDFDPTRQPPPDTSQPAEERPVGGLGIFMMRKLSTSLEHRRAEGRNVLVIQKDLEHPVLTRAGS